MVVCAVHEDLIRRCFALMKEWDVVAEQVPKGRNDRLFTFHVNLDNVRSDISDLKVHSSVQQFVRKQNFASYADHLDKTLQLLETAAFRWYDITRKKLDGVTDVSTFAQKQDAIADIKKILFLAREIMSYCLGILRKEVEIISAFNDCKSRRLLLSQLGTGDVLAQLSNPQGFVNIVHNAIFNALRGSTVNHVMLLLREDSLKFIDFVGKGMRYKDFKIRPGAVYVVMRPELQPTQEHELIRNVHEIIDANPKYAGMERIGAYVSRAIALVVPTPVRNFWGSDDSYFCSKFIDEMFMKVGVRLTHRSMYSNTVLASDVLCSSALSFAGLIFDDSPQTEEILTREAKRSDL